MPYGIDFAAADLDFFLTKSQVQMASGDVNDSFEKWDDGGVRPVCEPVHRRSPEHFETNCSHLGSSDYDDRLPTSQSLSDIRTERGPDIPHSAASCF
jgi:hypothetical protein